MASRRAAPACVADYLAALEPGQARVLKRYLALIARAVPGSTRVISYGIPAFRRQRVFMFCAAFKGHIGIYPPVSTDARLASALKPYANAKGNLRFPLAEPVPEALVTRIARALAKQAERQDD